MKLFLEEISKFDEKEINPQETFVYNNSIYIGIYYSFSATIPI